MKHIYFWNVFDFILLFDSPLSSFIGLELQIIAAKFNQTTQGQNLFNCISLNIQHVENCFEQQL
jgi:hypothetical protein